MTEVFEAFSLLNRELNSMSSLDAATLDRINSVSSGLKEYDIENQQIVFIMT